jgi:L,D-peptidoglycan transpeptidase YkuD (ErfK/YbiS/YcfS/YnhG family)
MGRLTLLLCGLLLATTAEARQLIVAIAPDDNTFQGHLRLFRQSDDGAWRAESDFIPVLFGKKGLAWGRGLHAPQPGLQKKEGDMRTPAGRFKIGFVMGNEPTLPPGSQGWPYHHKTASTAWIDDGTLPHYNDVVEVDLKSPPAWFVSQRMKIEDPIYHWLVLIEHNYGPEAKPGYGSAIFFHSRRGETVPTGGCTTMERGQLVNLIRWLNPKEKPEFVVLSAANYQRLCREWKLPEPKVAVPCGEPMKMNPKIRKRLKVALVVALILGGLIYWLISIAEDQLAKGKMVATFNNARQIHLRIITAALDAQTTGSPSPWPGDLPIRTTRDYVTFLVTNNIVHESDLTIFSGPGFPAAQSLKEFSEKNCAFTIYRVSSKDPADTIIFSSKNVDLVTGRIESKGADFKKCFVVFRMGGDGSFYKSSQGLDTNLIGQLPPRLPAALAP